MSRNRWSRIAKRARDKFDIQYTAALQSCRDVYEAPGFEERMEKLKAEGMAYSDAMIRMIEEDFEFYDEPFSP